MNGLQAKTLGQVIGTGLRLLTGAIAFGYWQHSFVAGVFAYMLLATLETKSAIR